MRYLVLFTCLFIGWSDLIACDDLTEISWRDYKPCMSDSSSNSLNWCKRKR